jgi:hypothetical protein
MTKVLAQCANYNGNNNVLFMMNKDDFRIADGKFGYTVLGDAKYTNKTKTLAANGKTYKVFSDWSVKEATV